MRLAKHLTVFLFLFAVLERSGIPLLSLLGKISSNNAIEQVLQDPENKEFSNNDLPLKELWVSSSYNQVPDPFLFSSFLLPEEESQYFLRFYPSVPTPPPDLRNRC